MGHMPCRNTERPGSASVTLVPRRPRLPPGGTVLEPYPSWLNAGDNSWQMTAATFVGLMSIPALAVLYGGLVQKKWAINTVMMVFTTFCLVLITWVLWAFKLGFGTPLLHTFIGDPRTILGHAAEQGQASIPLVNPGVPNWHLPGASVEYFQFVFAAITPILFIGSVLGRISFKVWMIFVPLWITFAYAVNAFLLWGGGYWAGKGALDFSGGYVIHLAAGTSGFVAAAVIGPRLKRDRERAIPNNLMFVAVGAGILWLGWNGFNGGDPYFAGADAAAAVVNTNLATAVAMMTWIIMDMAFSSEKKPTFLGGLVLPAEVRLAVQQGRRRARRGLHPRHRRAVRRPAGRPARRPEHDRLPRARQGQQHHNRRPVLRAPEAAGHPGRRRAHDHHLGRGGHVRHPHDHQACVQDEPAPARLGPGDRRRGRARRGGVPV